MYNFVYLDVKNDYDVFYLKLVASKIDNIYYSPSPLYFSSYFVRPWIKIHYSKKTNHFFDLPFKWIWRKSFLKSFPSKIHYGRGKDVCFIITGFGDIHIKDGLFAFIKKRYPECKIIFSLNDVVSLYERLFPKFFETYNKYVDGYMTYNIIDAKKYGFIYCPPVIYDYGIDSNDMEPKYDIVFVGKNKNRLETLKEVASICDRNSISYKFYITNVEEEEMIKGNPNFVFNKPMNYFEVIQLAKESRCILNIVQDGAAGITLRDYEAIGLRKILITNSHFIEETGLYDKDKVIFLEDLPERLEIIKKYKCQKWAIDYDKYSLEHCYFSLEAQIQEGNKKKI